MTRVCRTYSPRYSVKRGLMTSRWSRGRRCRRGVRAGQCTFSQRRNDLLRPLLMDKGSQVQILSARPIESALTWPNANAHTSRDLNPFDGSWVQVRRARAAANPGIRVCAPVIRAVASCQRPSGAFPEYSPHIVRRTVCLVDRSGLSPNAMTQELHPKTRSHRPQELEKIHHSSLSCECPSTARPSPTIGQCRGEADLDPPPTETAPRKLCPSKRPARSVAGKRSVASGLLRGSSKGRPQTGITNCADVRRHRPRHTRRTRRGEPIRKAREAGLEQARPHSLARDRAQREPRPARTPTMLGSNAKVRREPGLT